MEPNEYTGKEIFSQSNAGRFDELALGIFRWQAVNNPIYHDFLAGLKVDPFSVKEISGIPFLPIDLFKTRKIITGNGPVEQVFSSSGTTGSVQSKHYVTSLRLYIDSFRKGFEYFYGDIKNYTLIALLPSYLEREGSSLVYMTEDLVKQAANGSGFYLHNKKELSQKLKMLREKGAKILLLGVTYALLDLAEQHPMDLGDSIIMETGGMKGQRKEMIREEVHGILCKEFKAEAIHSEYGMTELLSQAYSKGNGIFNCPPWMKVIIRDTEDPLSAMGSGRTGGINVIDLANLNSCSFIATQDLGKVYKDSSFEVLGRFDNSDIRGCNLMVM